jgi:ABC-2 type transport system permease protein
MKGLWAVYRKELFSLFASPIFYVVAFIFLFIAGYFFYGAIAYYNLLSFQAHQDPFIAAQLSIGNMVLRPFLSDLSIVFLLVSPLLTMRLYAEERKTGTLELLFTYPLTDLGTLLAKFAAVLTVFLVLLLGTFPGIFILEFIGDLNWKVVFCGYLGFFLLGSSFISLGLFTSALTQNQIIAAVLSFGILLMFWIIGWVKSLVSTGWASLVSYLSIMEHFSSFSSGVLDSRDLLYYIMFIVFFLFLSQRQIESYRWRG